MQHPTGDRPWVVGCVGFGSSTGTQFSALEESGDYEVRSVAVDAVTTSTVDALLVDLESLEPVVERLLADDVAGCIPVLTIGESDEITLSRDALDVVDDHVRVENDDLAPLVDALDDVMARRWQNLGMAPDQFLDRLFERVPAHLYVKDAAGRHVRASNFYDAPNQLIGRTDRDAYPDEAFGEQAFGDDKQVVQSGEPIIEKEEFNPGDGNWTITSKMPVSNERGETVGLFGFTQLITTRKEYERALERQNERLEQFSGILSHDLRNPLSVADGHLELARESHPNDEHLDRVAESLDRIDELVEDVLTLTRGGQRVVEVERVSLSELCRSCWDVVETADATLSVTDVTIEADQGRLRHVFENLFRNAVEHGGDDVQVSIGPLEDGDGFYVADDGPGIPADDREQIFERGYTTSSEGTGLGLEIVRQIVDAHDWEVAVVESETGGTRFEIRGVDVVA